MSVDHWWNDADGRKPTALGEKPVCFTFSTTDLAWTGLRTNPGLCSFRLVADFLIHGIVHTYMHTYIHTYINRQFVLHRELESVTIGKASLLVLYAKGTGVYCGNERNINTLNGEDT